MEQTLLLAGINVKSIQADNIQRTANLYAPISGYIKTSNIKQGNFVSPNNVIMEIINTNDLYINLNAFEQNINSLKKGQNIKFYLANENQFNRSATIVVVGKSASTDISERTLQRLCSNRTISYSIISGKSYYTIAEIKRLLNERKIRSTDEWMNDLINNHKLHAEQRRNTKTNK